MMNKGYSLVHGGILNQPLLIDHILNMIGDNRLGLALYGCSALVIGNNAPLSIRQQALDAKALLGDRVQLCSNADDEVEINLAIDALTSSRANIETVKLIGSFTTGAAISMDSYTRLDLTEAYIAIADGANCHGIVNSDTASGNSYLEIVGGILDFNGAKQTADVHGIRWQKVTHSKIIRASLTGAYHHNINITGTSNSDCEIIGVYAEYSGAGSAPGSAINGANIVINGARIHVKDCTTYRGAFHGIQVYTGATYCEVSGCTVIEAANEADDSSGHGFLSDAVGTIFTHCTAIDTKEWDGFNTSAAKVIFNGCKSIGSKRHGFYINNTGYCQVVNCEARNSVTVASSAGIEVAGASALYNLIQGNLCIDDQGGSATQKYGVQTGTSADYNKIIGNICYGNTSYGVNPVGTNNTYDYNIMSSALDLSGAASDVDLFVAPCALVITMIEFVYTEASSADAGVDIRIGRYYASVALDDNYYFNATSEVSKALGYIKRYVLADMTVGTMSKGHIMTVGTAGGKTGTGEIKVIVHYAYNTA